MIVTVATSHLAPTLSRTRCVRSRRDGHADSHIQNTHDIAFGGRAYITVAGGALAGDIASAKPQAVLQIRGLKM